MIDEDARRKRGHRSSSKLDAATKRSHCVSVRVNDAELEKLDRQRERVGMQRGEFLRAAALHKLPPTIPELNRRAWSDLGRALGNLSTVATAMRGGEYRELKEIQAAIKDLRQALIGAKK
jgi:hypothetical protein